MNLDQIDKRLTIVLKIILIIFLIFWMVDNYMIENPDSKPSQENKRPPI